MNCKIDNCREYYDIKYINDVLNNIEYSIFEAFNKIYPNSTHTRWDSNMQFNVYCFDSDNEYKYNVHVIIYYNIFDDAYIVRLNILDKHNININNIHLMFFTYEVIRPMNIKEISKLIKNAIDNI